MAEAPTEATAEASIRPSTTRNCCGAGRRSANRMRSSARAGAKIAGCERDQTSHRG